MTANLVLFLPDCSLPIVGSYSSSLPFKDGFHPGFITLPAVRQPLPFGRGVSLTLVVSAVPPGYQLGMLLSSSPNFNCPQGSWKPCCHLKFGISRNEPHIPQTCLPFSIWGMIVFLVPQAQRLPRL